MPNTVQLIAASHADFDALICGDTPANFRVADGGVETPEVLKMLQGLANSIRSDCLPAAWLMIVDNEVCGLVSLLSVPDINGRIAIGYGVAASCRRRGICSGAIAELIRWATDQPTIHAIVAETSIQNLPSQKVLINNGFEQIGDRVDPDDGALYCWERAIGD
jgi:RimJ/RimL family protein N-acetyltransferase